MIFKIILLLFGAYNTLALPFEKTNKGDSSYLLPDNAILPQYYKLNIDVTKSFVEIEKREFFGEVQIEAVVNKENLKEIVLHSLNNQIIGDIKVNDKISKYRFDLERQFLIITPVTSLNKGSKIIISITYKGKLNDDMNGFYVSKYTENSKEKYVLTTQFEPTHARKAFPCFDEPKYKAIFELTFKKEPKYLVMSNSHEPSFGRDQDIVNFPITPKMSTYLVAFIVSEFDFRDSPYNEDFKVWSRPNAIDQTKWAANYVFNITDSLNKFTGIQYNNYIPKMDMAALPDFSAGAMENWGMLTYRETALLVNDELSTNEDIQRVITVIAHEVAHQWFGDLVTCHWWKNAWLNEGFATYFEYHTTDNVRPEWEMRDQFVIKTLQGVFGVDALATTTPITLDVYTPQEISSHFGAMTYAKAGSVIRMMEHFLGSNAFQKGLQNYLQINKLSYTEPKDLFSAIQEVVDELNVPLEYSLNNIMTNWISQPGYPVINVTSLAPGTFLLTQQRFFLNPEEKENPKQYWFVPISYTTSDEWKFTDTMPKLWLTPKEPTRTITVDSDLMILNVQQSGYYRVNYDTKLWQRIAKVLASNQGANVHRLNKAQLVDDVLNLARADLVDYSTAFNITDFLATETGYFPWYSAFANFRFLLQRYSDTDNTGMEIRRYIRGIMKLLIKDKEFNETTESQVESFNRVQALEWACNLGHEKCISQAKELFHNYKENGKRIPRNLRSVVYCTALRNGNVDDWNFLWNEYLVSNIAAVKVGIINALGCSNDENILKRYLQKSIEPNGGIRSQDASYVFTAVYTGNSLGVEVAFEFLANNYMAIADNYSGMNALEQVVRGLAARMTDKTRIEEFSKLLKSSDYFTTFRDAAIAIMSDNIAWSEKYSEIIGDILTQKRTASIDK